MNIWIIINSIIFGILLKIYDEIEDCNIYINNYIYLFIQITLIISLIIVCYNDKYILIFFTCLSILYLTNIFLKLSIYKNNDPIENIYWKFFILIILIIFCLRIKYIKFDYLTIIITGILFCSTIWENYYCKEEYSIYKLIGRILHILFLFFELLILIFFKSDVYLLFIITFISYFITWVIFKQYITNKYINLIHAYSYILSYIWKKIKKLYKKLKSKKLIKKFQQIK